MGAGEGTWREIYPVKFESNAADEHSEGAKGSEGEEGGES
jgi:hypothetical protein